MLSLGCSLLGEVCYTQSNLFPRGLDSAPSQHVTIMILMSTDYEYCLSPGYEHLPELYLSLSTLLISMDQLLAIHRKVT